MLQQPFPIGTKVWAKVKGHSAWPGQVADPDHIASKAVLADRPKKAERYLPILFYKTLDYAWVATDTLKLYDECKEKTTPKKPSKGLLEAMQSADVDLTPSGRHPNPNAGQSDEEESDSEEEEEEEEEEQANSKKTPSKQRKPRAKSAATTPSVKKATATPKAKTTPTAASATKKKAESKKSKETPAEKTPSAKRKRAVKNEKVNDDDREEGSETENAPLTKQVKKPRTNPKSASKEATTAEVETPKKKDPQQRSPFDQLMYFRHRLQKMMKESPEEMAISPRVHSIMSEVEEFPMTMELLRSTKMGKLMKRVSQIQFSEDQYSIKERTHCLMRKWKREFQMDKEGDGNGKAAAAATETNAMETDEGDVRSTSTATGVEKNIDEPVASAASSSELQEPQPTTREASPATEQRPRSATASPVKSTTSPTHVTAPTSAIAADSKESVTAPSKEESFDGTKHEPILSSAVPSKDEGPQVAVAQASNESPFDQLASLRHKLEKMINESPEEKAAFSEVHMILSKVEQFSLTKELLMTTKLGEVIKRISHIQFSEDPQNVKARAAELTSKWKRDYQMESNEMNTEETRASEGAAAASKDEGSNVTVAHGADAVEEKEGKNTGDLPLVDASSSTGPGVVGPKRSVVDETEMEVEGTKITQSPTKEVDAGTAL